MQGLRRFLVGFALVALGSTLPVAASAEQGATPASAGDAAAAAGDWTTALAEFEAQAVRSEDAAAWYRVGVARAMVGDAAGAADAFRRVAAIEPAFPDIGARIAAADARAAADAAEALDRPGFFDDPDARIQARRDALERADLLYASRAAAGLPAGAAPQADATEARLIAQPADAVAHALAAVAAEPDDVSRYLAAADALRLAGELEAARYYLDLYADLGGDAAAAAPVRRALDRADLPGR